MSQTNRPSLLKAISIALTVVLGLVLVYRLTTGGFRGDDTLASLAAGPARASAGAKTAGPVDQPGELTYGRLCQACHGTGAAGAPALGHREAWEPRLAQGLEALLQTVIAGKGAMPPRGTCADCSDDDLRAAIAFMVSRVQ